MKYFINILILTMVVTALKGQSTEVSIGQIDGDIGDTVLVPVTVNENLGGLDIYSLQFEINFNSNLAICDSVDRNGTITENANLLYKVTSNKIKISAINATALTGTGTLFHLRFVLLKPGTNNLTFQGDTVNNYFNEGVPSLVLKKGWVRILSPPNIYISPTKAELVVGETLKFRASGGTAPHKFSVSDISLASIDQNGLLTALKRGTVDVMAEDANGYKNVLTGILIRSFALQIRDTSYYQKNAVEIPVLLWNYDNSVAYSGEFTLKYNKDILSLDDVKTDPSIINGSGNIQYHSEPGKISFSFASAQGVSKGGTLLYLQFKIADRTGGSTDFVMDHGMINENLGVKSFLGRFTINRLPPLNLTPKIGELITGETMQFNVSGGFEPYQWKVAHSELAFVDQNGLLTARAGGVTQLIVEDKLGAQTFSGDIQIYDTWVAVRDSTTDVHNYHMMLPLDIGALPPSNPVVATSGKLKYQSDAIDSIKLITTNSLSADWMALSRSDTRTTNISIAGSEGLAHDGGVLVYMHIYFNRSLKTNSTIHFDLEDYYLNEGTPRTKTKRGTLKVGIVTALAKTKGAERTLVTYPNPANDVLSIKSNDGESGLTSFVILDLSGKSIQNGQFGEDRNSVFNVDISDLRSGTYMILIRKSNGQNENMRFIKQ